MVEYIVGFYSRVAQKYFFRLQRGKSFWFKQYFQIVQKLSSLILYYWIKKNPIKKFDTSVCEDLIVSVATFPARIDTIWMMIESVLRQRIRPREIRIYISEREFRESNKSLPDFLTYYKKFGVNVYSMENNLRSHDKYFYVLQEVCDKRVITLDDDLYYPSDTLERLLQMSVEYPDSVCANITRKINIKSFFDYDSWDKNPGHIEYNGSHVLLALGYGGVLYPTSFRPLLLFNQELLQKLAFYADDLWLKAMELKSDTLVVTGTYFPPPLSIPFTQTFALRKVNCGNLSKNNEQWAALDKEFKLRQMFV